MRYVVLLEDNDNHADMRPKYMQAHLAFLEHNAKNIEAAGPLTNSNDATSAGGLWLVNADTSEDVRVLIEADHFWPTGLRKSYRILEWQQVFANIS